MFDNDDKGIDKAMKIAAVGFISAMALLFLTSAVRVAIDGNPSVAR